MPSEPVAFKPWTPIPVQHTIPDPSPAFEAFLHEYFVNPWGPTRREEDLKLFKKLTAAELEEAKRLIEEHLGDYDWFVRLAGVLKMHSVVPKLRELLAEGRRSTFDVSLTLHRLKAISTDDLCSTWLSLMDGRRDFDASYAILTAPFVLPPTHVARLIRRALRSVSLRVRESGVESLLVLEDHLRHSRRRSKSASARRWEALREYLRPPLPPLRGASRMASYVGDEVYCASPVFEERLTELDRRLDVVTMSYTPAGRRRVPGRS